MKKITFTIDPGLEGVSPPPTPGSKSMPAWLKRLETYTKPRPDDEYDSPTVKACSPFKDAIFAGYVIPLAWSVKVVAKEGGEIHFSWIGDVPDKIVNSHSPSQVDGYPTEQADFFKWTNVWTIKTPPGYSTLFVPVMNRGEQPFKVFSAIVDTDTYFNVVNFPFTWTQYPYEGVLEAGTPLIQAIPFKRESWQMEARALGPKEALAKHKEGTSVHALLHHYTRNRRQRKLWR